MKTSLKLAGFAALLGLGFGGAWLVGAATDSDTDQPAAGAAANGLASAAAGYRLEPDTTALAVDTPSPYRFRVVDERGEPVDSFTTTHEKPMHLIVASNDLASFQHLHPSLDGDGIWSVDLAVTEPGDYRVFADFQPEGAEPLTLSTPATAPGTAQPKPLGTVESTVSVDGYALELVGEIAAGAANEITIRVTRDGQPVTNLQPYLGAAGHLVALRAGDLAYAHTHPTGALATGPEITFVVEPPSAATYRLFLNFQIDGVVRTAAFTATATAAADVSQTTTSEHGDH